MRLRLTVALISAAAIAGIVCIWPRPATAESVAVLAHAEAGAPSAAPEVAAALTEALVRGGEQVVTAPLALAHSRIVTAATATSPSTIPTTPQQQRALAAAQSLARSGWRAYLAVEPSLAEKRLQGAADAALSLASLPEGLALYADTILRLGVVFNQSGRRDKALAMWQLASTIEPGRTLSIAEFAPEVVAAYEAVRADTLTPIAGTLRITLPAMSDASPSAPMASVVDIAVDLDGQPATQVVASLGDQVSVDLALAPGQHILVVRAPGYAPHIASIAVPAVEGPFTWSVPLTTDPLTSAVLSSYRRQQEGGSVFVPPNAESKRAARELAQIVFGVIVHGELDSVLLAASTWQAGQPILLGQRCWGEEGAPVGDGAGALQCTDIVEITYHIQNKTDELDSQQRSLRQEGGRDNHRATALTTATLALVEALSQYERPDRLVARDGDPNSNSDGNGDGVAELVFTDPRIANVAERPQSPLSPSAAAGAGVAGERDQGAPDLLTSGPTLTERRSRGCTWCRNRWVWIGAGTATAVVAGTLWLLLRNGGRDITNVTVDPCEFGPCRP